MGKIFIHDFLSRVNDYIEPMAIFTTWVKFYSTEYFCTARVGGLDKIYSAKISVVMKCKKEWYIIDPLEPTTKSMLVASINTHEE